MAIILITLLLVLLLLIILVDKKILLTLLQNTISHKTPFEDNRITPLKDNRITALACVAYLLVAGEAALGRSKEQKLKCQTQE